MSHSREPIGNTCPDIDKTIDEIKKAEKACNFNDSEEIEDLQQRLKDIEYYLFYTTDRLEKLRSANSALREWAESEANACDLAENKIYQLESELQDVKELATN